MGDRRIDAALPCFPVFCSHAGVSARLGIEQHDRSTGRISQKNRVRTVVDRRLVGLLVRGGDSEPDCPGAGLSSAQLKSTAYFFNRSSGTISSVASWVP